MTETTTATDQVQLEILDQTGNAPEAPLTEGSPRPPIEEMEFFGDVVESWREEAEARASVKVEPIS